jgi:chromosome segregation ATPase
VKRFLGGYDDYREKAALVAGPLEAAAPVRAGLTPRELRRARARERAVRQPRLRELRETVATAEAQIARLEAERNALERDINAGAAATDYAGSCRRFHRVVERLEEQTAVWERAATELQSLEREQAEAQEAIAAGDGD